MIKVFAFDVFGTLVDMSHIPHEQLKAYGDHIRKPDWSPLVLPDLWRSLRAFGDVYDGLHDIRANYGVTVTLSNAPISFQLDLWEVNASEGMQIDYCVPLELLQVFKPNIEAYRSLFRLFPHFEPQEFCMVTANEHFGDLEASRSLGMQAVLIRGKSGIDVTDLPRMMSRMEAPEKPFKPKE